MKRLLLLITICISSVSFGQTTKTVYSTINVSEDSVLFSPTFSFFDANGKYLTNVRKHLQNNLWNIILPAILRGQFEVYAPFGPEIKDGGVTKIESELQLNYELYPDKGAYYPGESEAMKQFLAGNIKYPEKSVELNDQGRVYLEFIVEIDGSISNINIRKGVSNEIDSEAKRAVESMPNWVPAELDGKSVRTKVRLPLNFCLDEDCGSNSSEQIGGYWIEYTRLESYYDRYKFGKSEYIEPAKEIKARTDDGYLNYPIFNLKSTENVQNLSYFRNQLQPFYSSINISDIPLYTSYGEDSVDINGNYVLAPNDTIYLQDLDIISYLIKEKVFYNKKGLEKKREIQALAPLAIEKDIYNPDKILLKEVFWFDFNDLSPLLKEYHYFDRNGNPITYLNYFLEKKYKANIIRNE